MYFFSFSSIAAVFFLTQYSKEPLKTKTKQNLKHNNQNKVNQIFTYIVFHFNSNNSTK